MKRSRSKVVALAGLLALVLLTAGALLSDLNRTREAPAGQFTYRFNHAEVHVLQPRDRANSVALLISDAGGWSKIDRTVAARFTARGVTVAGISLPTMAMAGKKYGTGQHECVDYSMLLHDIAKDVQHRLGFTAYVRPVVAGRGAGGAAAYTAFGQSPTGIYRGLLTIEPAGDYASSVKPCGDWVQPRGVGMVHIARLPQPPAPWVSFADAARKGPAGEGMAAVGGTVVSARADWRSPEVSSALEPLFSQETGGVADMPLTLVAAAPGSASDLMVVMYSGDAGWAGLDRRIAGELAARGIPVAGVSCLEYFWQQRSPVEAARDLSQLIERYSSEWRRPKVLLVGYSYGADVSPFIYSALSEDMKRRVERVSLLGLSDKADFQFHLSSWLDISTDDALPTVPEINALGRVDAQCIRGADETESACPAINNPAVKKIMLPGDHHFDNNPRRIVDAFLAGLPLTGEAS